MQRQKVGIIGAGPAGLTASWKLSEGGADVTVFEADTKYVGGIARTVEYKGFRFDIGGHRFFFEIAGGRSSVGGFAWERFANPSSFVAHYV